MVSAILVANATAQSGRAEARIERARQLLDEAGITHEFVPTEAGGSTVGAVRRAVAAGARVAIAMGGDGTFAEVAKGILGSDHAAEVAMGMLPMGTANDQGKSFGLDTGEAALAANVAVIAAGHIVEMDVGRVRELDAGDRVVASDLFFDSFSVGLGAAVLAERNRDRDTVAAIPVVRSLYRDQMVYAGALVKRLTAALGRGATFDVEAVIDGESHYLRSLIDVIVKNTKVYGGEWVLAPDTEADDGRFELVPVSGLGDFGTRMVTALRGSPIGPADLARLGIEQAPAIAGQHFELTIHQPGAEAPPPAQIDGEELPAGDKFVVDVLPGILRLVVPGPATPE